MIKNELESRFSAFCSELADWELSEAIGEYEFCVSEGMSDDEVMECVEYAVAMAD